jgi:hypothetical protein
MVPAVSAANACKKSEEHFQTVMKRQQIHRA